ncbi:MAG: CarD family transcriptional regulator [Firmicutes bacterium HGW-Firmicutes-12]|jgi:CarD family transcriptional regulator|nr:MAG: CarD family transcriptional regulator [Firmicutes bacterium HGW-Firmicutes-12]
MYQIGDKVVYPMHGASVIEAIAEREILGKKKLYYLMTIKNMQVMFPIGSKMRLRKIVDKNILEDVLNNFNHTEPDIITNPTHRYRNNLNKMKSGDIYEGAQVIRDLISMSRKKVLAAGDKMMLENARHVLTSELMLVQGLNQVQADDVLDTVINENEVVNNLS